MMKEKMPYHLDRVQKEWVLGRCGKNICEVQSKLETESKSHCSSFSALQVRIVSLSSRFSHSKFWIAMVVTKYCKE